MLSLVLLGSLGVFHCAPDPALPRVTADTLKREHITKACLHEYCLNKYAKAKGRLFLMTQNN